MYTTLALSFAMRVLRQPGLAACLLGAAVLMNAAVPAWAFQKPAIPDGNVPRQDDYPGVVRSMGLFLPPSDLPQTTSGTSEILRAIRDPDVAVFPIRVAGPAVAFRNRTLANKIAQASGGNIAVVYPDIGEPYRSVFTQIVNGIEDRANGHAADFAVGKNVNIGDLNNALRSKNTKVVIALGQQGVKVASALDSDIGMVVGGVLTVPENEARDMLVNSLSPDPALLFSRLKGLMPGVQRVFTVYDPRQNAWMMGLAKEAARAQGLELTVYAVQDLRGAMLAYQKIFSAADSSHDALWLPQDPTSVEDSTVLPMVLQESWSKNLAVFSSSFGHVRRGILFSLYPNNVELGRHLADSALSLASGGNQGAGMLPLREVLMAVNLRTARHLGLNASRTQDVDMAFPEQ